MRPIKTKRLLQLISRCKGKKIAVIGDVMLDRYIWGEVARISPEAPVPVVEVERESIRLGGAANVANNVQNLGGIPYLFGVLGDDHAGKDLSNLLIEKNFENAGMKIDYNRPTTLKTRIIANNQHVVRADFETTNDISEELSGQLIRTLEKIIKELSGIIIQDYNKGVITKSLIKRVIELALEHDCPITIDPKFNNFFEYTGVTLFKPNIAETQSAFGFALDSKERVAIAGRLLLDRLQCKHVLITRGSEGMALFSKNGKENTVKTKARKIHDVSGAGDTVISTMTMILASGGDIIEAATIANYAAGVVCAEIGIVPIDSDKLVGSITIDNDS